MSERPINRLAFIGNDGYGECFLCLNFWKYYSSPELAEHRLKQHLEQHHKVAVDGVVKPNGEKEDYNGTKG